MIVISLNSQSIKILPTLFYGNNYFQIGIDIISYIPFP